MQRKRKAVTDPLGSPKFICALNLYISNFIGTEAYDNPEANLLQLGFFGEPIKIYFLIWN